MERIVEKNLLVIHESRFIYWLFIVFYGITPAERAIVSLYITNLELMAGYLTIGHPIMPVSPPSPLTTVFYNV